jgi:hypothetical protein
MPEREREERRGEERREREIEITYTIINHTRKSLHKNTLTHAHPRNRHLRTYLMVHQVHHVPSPRDATNNLLLWPDMARLKAQWIWMDT